MTRARDLSNDEANGGGATPPFVAGKNAIINGDFGIWQRGTSFSSTGQYTADRWVCVMNGTTTRQAFTPGSAPVSGYESPYYLNWTLSGSAQNAEILQRIENARTLAGQTVTLSFWARSTVGAQPLNVAIYQNFGTGGSPSSMVSTTLTSGVSPYTPTSSWQRYVFTFSLPSISGKTFGTNNDSFLWVRPAQFTTTATNTSLDLWGVQLEAGSVATPFTPAGGGFPGAELALCQRYYFRTTGGSGYQPVCNGFASSTTNVMGYVQYPVPMRTTPSAIEYATLQCNDSTIGTVVSAVAFSGTEVGPSAATLNFTCGSMTTFRPVKVLQNNSASGYLALSAEL